MSKQYLGETSTSCSYCVICNDTKPARSLIHTDCRHCFCKDCIQIYFGKKIQENISPVVKCPEKDCKSLLGKVFWRRFLPKEVFDRWNNQLIEGRVLANPEMIECPSCFGKFVDDGRCFFIRACTNCWCVFCMMCRVEWHMGMSCVDFQFLLRDAFRRRNETRPYEDLFGSFIDFI